MIVFIACGGIHYRIDIKPSDGIPLKNVVLHCYGTNLVCVTLLGVYIMMLCYVYGNCQRQRKLVSG